MRYFDLPVGAVLIESEESVELVLGKEGTVTPDMVRIKFLNLGTGSVYTVKFYDNEVVPDDEVILPEGG